MSDVDCPYCGARQEICHDDDYGYREDETFFQECGECDKTFGFTTSISFYHEATATPCQNEGGEHDWQPIHGSPAEYFANKRRCSYCDEEKTITPDTV